MECLGSVLTNKYAEGLPGARYYGGNEVVDKVENLCRDRALQAYRLDPKKWGVNVQPYSGSSANWALYTGILQPNDRLMGLDLPHGGHLTHGFYTAKKKVSSSSVYFQSMPYRLGNDGTVDFDALQKSAELFKPKLIICGGSAYPREWDYKKFRQVADSVEAMLMVDMAHISGLVAAGVLDDPFQYADFVTTTTHKSLRGPRSGMIFFKKESEGKSIIEENVNNAVFPSCQGGPHINKIGAVAAQLAEVMSPEWKGYALQVKANAKALAAFLLEKGYTLSSGGTDNHLLLLNLRPLNITGSKVERMCDSIHITVNKNSVVGDKSAVTPGGVRLGTCAMTTRGLKEDDFKQVGAFIHQGIQEALKIQADGGGSKMKLKDFEVACQKSPAIQQLKKDVVAFAKQFPFPGYADAFEGY